MLRGAGKLGCLAAFLEHIFSIAPDGLYIHLYEAATIRWQQDGQPMELAVKTHFPYDSAVRCTVKTGNPTEANFVFRVPSWAAEK